VGQGYVDEHGALVVYLMNGNSKVMRVADPWGRRDQRGKKRTGKKAQRSHEAPPDVGTYRAIPVHVVFVRNRGRAAVTVQRCRYTANLEVTGFTFEPQPGRSPWGDLLPKRLDPGEEIVLLHEKVEMAVFLNAVLKDHGVAETTWSIVLELGDGEEVWAKPSIVTTVGMTDDELEQAFEGRRGRRLERIEILRPPRRRATLLRRWFTLPRTGG
jgi:hypothetical protein